MHALLKQSVPHGRYQIESLYLSDVTWKSSKPGNVTCKLLNYLCRLYTGSCEEYIKRTVVQTGHYLVLKVTHIVNVASDTDRGNSLLLYTYRSNLQQDSILKIVPRYETTM